MKRLNALLAVPAIAVCAVFASPSLPHGTQAAAAGACGVGPFFHDERREGGLCCFADHFHSAVGAGEATKAKALAVAIKGWKDFVWLEYGGAYDNWAIAHSKSVSCTSTNGWTCTVEARACHRG